MGVGYRVRSQSIPAAPKTTWINGHLRGNGDVVRRMPPLRVCRLLLLFLLFDIAWIALAKSIPDRGTLGEFIFIFIVKCSREGWLSSEALLLHVICSCDQALNERIMMGPLCIYNESGWNWLCPNKAKRFVVNAAALVSLKQRVLNENRPPSSTQWKAEIRGKVTSISNKILTREGFKSL